MKPALDSTSSLTLKAVYSRTRKSAKSLIGEKPGVDIYSNDSGPGGSYQDLLRRTDISAVIIVLPITTLADFVQEALSAGKHVLSEKPIAENMEQAVKLLEWYSREIKPFGVTWSVAENFRYFDCFKRAAVKVGEMGRVLGFRAAFHKLIEQTGGDFAPFLATEWREKPAHQGGFLLDGGVHYAAALRLMLGPSNLVTSLSAHTTLLRSYLPPVDTIDAVWKLKNGCSGTFSLSFGSTFTGSEWSVACEDGVVSVRDGYNEVNVNGKMEKVQNEDFGVSKEVYSWGEALQSQKQHASQRPEEALADLELIEAMLRSGETDGTPQQLKFQS